MNDTHDTLTTEISRLQTQVRALEARQRGHSEDATADINAKLAAIVESSDDAIISKTLEGIITTWNAGATRIFGYTEAEIVGRSIQTIIPQDRLPEEFEILARLKRGERMEHFNTVRLAKDGRLIDVSLTISPIRNHEGTIVGISKIARDITQQRRTEAELTRAKEAAEAANAAKDQFLAVLSHELRTPLMPVLAGLSLLERGGLTQAQIASEISSMQRHVSLESQLIDDLLDHTRIGRGKIQLKLEQTDVRELLRAVIEMCQSEMAAKNLKLSVNLSADAHFLNADPKRLQQVFWNLLKNAIKFTSKGGAIAVHTLNENDAWVMSVTDSGIGISPELIGRIFQPFEQGSQTITRRFGGLGLGLSISQNFVNMHHGTLVATSEGRNKGATFTVSLPGAAIVAPAAPPTSPVNGSGRPIALRLLLVEDHADTRRLVTRLLGSRGHKVVCAGSVRDAVDILKRENFDVLVSDIGLPDGTGLEVMAQARLQPNLKGIAVSGFGSPDDERMSREAGFAMHVSKPIDVRKLEEAIEHLAQAEPEPA